MKTREKYFSDYGFEAGEDKRLKKYCKNLSPDDSVLLLNAAIHTNPAICNELYVSIVKGMSYNELNSKQYIPMPCADFYGYQRKCLDEFKRFLTLYGRW